MHPGRGLSGVIGNIDIRRTGEPGTFELAALEVILQGLHLLANVAESPGADISVEGFPTGGDIAGAPDRRPFGGRTPVLAAAPAEAPKIPKRVVTDRSTDIGIFGASAGAAA